MHARHTAVYLRVSSKSQDLRSQEPDLKRWAAAQEGPVRWYQDLATGTTMERPGWAKLWADVQALKVSRVAVWRLDRLGRTAKGLTELFADLVRLDVGLHSVREGLDLSTPAGRLMAHVLASVAQYETEVRSERQRAGIAAAQARGKTFGRPKGTGKPLSIDADKRRLVHRLNGEGKPKARIAGLVGISRASVYQVLAEPPPPGEGSGK